VLWVIRFLWRPVLRLLRHDPLASSVWVAGCSDDEAWLAFHSGRVSLRLLRQAGRVDSL